MSLHSHSFYPFKFAWVRLGGCLCGRPKQIRLTLKVFEYYINTFLSTQNVLSCVGRRNVTCKNTSSAFRHFMCVRRTPPNPFILKDDVKNFDDCSTCRLKLINAGENEKQPSISYLPVVFE